jgi:hypothetical protein
VQTIVAHSVLARPVRHRGGTRFRRLEPGKHSPTLPRDQHGAMAVGQAEIEASSCSMTRGNASTRGLTRLIEDEARFRGAVHGHDIAGHGGEERSAAERVNGGLKDDFGGRYVRVRGTPRCSAT